LFGSTIESPGDLGGTDATHDFLVGATGESGTSNGRIYLLDGSDGSKIFSAESSNPEASGDFGDAIAEIGNVGGSSTSDLLVGAPGEDTNTDGDVTDDQGRAYIVDGETGDIIDVLESPVPDSPGRFGDAVGGIGDQDGDGTPEIVVGASQENADGVNNAGVAYIHAIPEISFVDGRDGESYNPDAASPGDNDVPLGRFKLSSSDSRSTLDNVTVSNEGSGASDVSTIELWRSADNSFETSSDNTKILEKSFSEPATFTGVGESIPAGGAYFFVVVDLGGSSSGEYDPAIASEADINFTDGQLSSVNGTQTSTFSVGDGEGYLSTGPNAPLPVELTRLEAAMTGSEAVTVRWRTAAERNNTGFEVQRRTGPQGAERGGNWTDVGFVESKAEGGTTTQAHTYRFRDEDLPHAADALTYRLRQIDTDGTANVSDPVTVERGAPDRLALLGTYPNPARSRATVRLAIPEQAAADDATLRVYDVMGRQVRTVEDVSGGRSTVDLDLNGLSSGVYVLRLSAGGATRTQRVTVVR
jgi:hypothetical protein